ncbi:multicopper oxidase family protein [Stappia sp.]|uniref:multicopper oxidase family protein n=1 Tax=Stappia sp. TaxID=1870903 RepID=UPI0032D8B60E
MTNSFHVSRRTVLLSGAAAGLALGLPRGAFAAGAELRDLEARPGTAALWEEGGPQADIWGYEGRVPGPVLRMRQGETLGIRFRNGLDQPSTIHWHGIRIDNAYDGVAGLTQPPVAPGESFDYLVNAPDAGTYWYHPHNRSWDQMARGLYGVLIVEEPGVRAYDRDVILTFDDWRLDEERQIDTASLGAMHDWAHAGRLGNVLTTNGEAYAKFPARPGERLRLRVLNTANSRVMTFRFAGLAPRLVALDGQPVAPEPLAEEAVRLAPAQRADLIVDLPETPATYTVEEASGQPFAACEFVVSGAPVTRASPLPEDIALPANPLPKALDMQDALAQDLLMEGGAMGRMREAVLKGETRDIRALVQEGKVWAFNGIAGSHMDPAMFTVARGRTVRMPIVNDTRWPHGIHVHGHHFKIVSRNGTPVAREEWRDTVLTDPGERVEIAFVADNPGKWMIHCHMLEHQAAGMMAWFEVT